MAVASGGAMKGGGGATDTPYARALIQGRDVLRGVLLDVASRLLTEEGPQALSMRRIAQEMGCSTMVLYTLFGSKQHVADTLYREGFARLQHALEAVPQADDSVAYLTALGHMYRANALAHPNYYGIMFGRPIPEFVPSPESRAQAAKSLQLLTVAAQRCIEAGRFREVLAAEVAETLWAAVHGAVSLELAGYFPEATTADRCFRNIMRVTGQWFLLQPPAACERCPPL